MIPTPKVTVLITATRVTGNEEARVERNITDQQLVGVSVACSKTVPQSIGVSSIPIVKSGRYGLAFSLLKVNLASSLVINKDNFCELNKRANDWFPIHSSLFKPHWHASRKYQDCLVSPLGISARVCFVILPIIAKTNLFDMPAKCTFLSRFGGIRYQFGLRYQVSDLISHDIKISLHKASDWLF